MPYFLYNDKRGKLLYQRFNDGFIETICGCMFAGKTEELIRRINILKIAKKEILVFKPKIDDRYSSNSIVSHDGLKFDSIVIDKASDIYDYLKETTEVVAIDEVQFFSDDIVDVCSNLANKGIRVIVAGLDNDFRGEPFGPMPKLLCVSEFVTKLTAICNVCANPATRTQRIINGEPASYNDPIVMVGASEKYEARCRKHHEVKDSPYKRVR